MNAMDGTEDALFRTMAQQFGLLGTISSPLESAMARRVNALRKSMLWSYLLPH
jgi:hypothetical protein